MKTRAPLLTLLAALALLAPACSKTPIGKVLEPEAATKKLREQVARLRKAGFLDVAPGGDAQPEDPVEFFQRLDGLDDFLDTCPDWDDSSLAHPQWWSGESAASLADRLKPLGPFFEEVSSLLDMPAAQRALAQGRHLARRTRPGTESLPPDTDWDPFATPPAPRVARWIDLLCARAVARAGTAAHSEDAVQALADALDLLWLVEDDSMHGTRIVTGLENEVLHCLQLVVPGPRVDPRMMKTEIDPRLARLDSRARVFAVLRREVSRRVEIAEALLSKPGRADQDHWLTLLGSSRALLPQHALEAIDIQDQLRSASSLCLRIAQYGPSGTEGGDHTFQELLDGVSELHDLENHVYLARVAIAANEWRYVHDEWPRFLSDLTYGDEPAPRLECRSRRLTYKREFSLVELALVGRRDSSPDPDPLAVWTWDTDVLTEFREASR